MQNPDITDGGSDEDPQPRALPNPNPLKGISVAGFKAFGRQQHIPLKPITLIFGANSSGKSSVLHSLLFANQTLKPGNLDIHTTDMGGDAVDLGGFRQFVYRRALESEVTFKFDFEIPAHFPFRSPSLTGVKEVQIEIRLGINTASKEIGVSSFSANVDGSRLFEMRRDENGDLRGHHWASEHPIGSNVLAACRGEKLGKYLKSADDDTVRAGIDDFWISFVVEDNTIPPFQCSISRDRNEALIDLLDSSNLNASLNQEQLRTILDLLLRPLIGEILADLRVLFERSVGLLEYLGPLRKLPRRNLDDCEISSEERHSGAFAWSRVKKEAIVRDKINKWLEALQIPYELRLRKMVHLDLFKEVAASQLQEILRLQAKKIARNSDLLSVMLQISESEPDDHSAYVDANPDLHESLAEEWFHAHTMYLDDERRQKNIKKKDAKYTMEEAMNDVVLDEYNVEPILEHYRDSRVEDESFLSSVDGLMSAQKEATTLADSIAESDPDMKSELSIIEMPSGTVLSHRDVGVGISQILPVLVHAFGSQGRLISIEQPEIHIHPKLQADLGDVFIESALGVNRNTFLLETHSEHLILRIMKRIRQTADGELDGRPSITRDDVCILFVEPGESGAVVREMPLTERGDLAKAWPGGFFEEGLNELF